MTYVTERLSEKAANYGAVGAVSSHWWLPSLDSVSTFCAEALPIVGFLWLLFQFALKIYDVFIHPRLKPKEEEEE